MTREKRTRNANGRSSIYLGSDGSWHGYVTVGTKDNGRTDRRHVRGKTQAAVTKKVRALEKNRDAGTIAQPGTSWTVEKWLTHWLDTIVAPPAISPNAHDAYSSAVRVHLIPGIGAHKLDKLQPEHLERLYQKMMRNGAAPGTAHQVHRTVRTALNEAVRRRHAVTNPALLTRAPRVRSTEVEPYTVDEVSRILKAAAAERNGARWAVALALGLRQGEALGLRWQDVDLADGFIVVRRNRLRPKWAHGCGGSCERKQAGRCPQRRPLRPETAETKSEAGRRGIGLPDPLVTLLREHANEQHDEKVRAADLWVDTDYVFTTETGSVLHPRTDTKKWKELLVRAAVPERRLHDARHTAATVLLLLGVTERAVMGVMGWSNTAMAARYQHITSAVRQDVAARVGGLLWQRPDGPPTTS